MHIINVKSRVQCFRDITLGIEGIGAVTDVDVDNGVCAQW